MVKRINLAKTQMLCKVELVDKNSLFENSAVKIAVDDIFHIFAQKAILFGEAIVIYLKGLKLVLNTLIMPGSGFRRQ